MSKRTQADSSPKIFSASALAVSVLPVPVGPAKNSTPLGLPVPEEFAPFSPVTARLMTSSERSSAVSCPLMRFWKSVFAVLRLSIDSFAHGFSWMPYLYKSTMLHRSRIGAH